MPEANCRAPLQHNQQQTAFDLVRALVATQIAATAASVQEPLPLIPVILIPTHTLLASGQGCKDAAKHLCTLQAASPKHTLCQQAVSAAAECWGVSDSEHHHDGDSAQGKHSRQHFSFICQHSAVRL